MFWGTQGCVERKCQGHIFRLEKAADFQCRSRQRTALSAALPPQFSDYFSLLFNFHIFSSGLLSSFSFSFSFRFRNFHNMMIMNGCDRMLFSRRCFISLQCFFRTFPVGYILGRPLVVFSSVFFFFSFLFSQRGSPFFQGRIGTLKVFSKERSASRVLLRWTAKPTTEHSIFICTLAHLQCFCCSHLSSFSIHHFFKLHMLCRC